MDSIIMVPSKSGSHSATGTQFALGPNRFKT